MSESVIITMNECEFLRLRLRMSLPAVPVSEDRNTQLRIIHNNYDIINCR